MTSQMPNPSFPEPVPSSEPRAGSEFVYRIGDETSFDAVQPLWEKLRNYHASLPWCFAAEVRRSSFGPRKQELLAKSVGGKLRIELVSTSLEAADIAYCVSTVSAARAGEVDSLFIDERFRGRGIGGELLRRALAWLDSAGATSKSVSVAHANKAAIALYEHFGFQPRSIILQQPLDGT